MLTPPRPARALAFFLVTAIALISCSKGSKTEPAAAEQSDVVATVNGKPVLQEEVSQMVQILQQQDFVPPDSLTSGVTREEKQRNFAIERLIERLLILGDAERLGLNPSDATIESELPNYKRERGLADSLPAGLTEADIRRGLADDMTIKAYVDSTIMPSISVTDADIQNFYNENPAMFERVHASHILITLEPGATDIQKAEARKKTQEAQAELNKGKEFAEVARQYSQDPYSKDQGGDLGFFARGQMVPTFDEAAFRLEPGQVSEIVETQFGYHIIKVSEKKKMTLEEVGPRMNDFMRDRKIAMAMEQRIKELREKAKIEKKAT